MHDRRAMHGPMLPSRADLHTKLRDSADDLCTAADWYENCLEKNMTTEEVRALRVLIHSRSARVRAACLAVEISEALRARIDAKPEQNAPASRSRGREPMVGNSL